MAAAEISANHGRVVRLPGRSVPQNQLKKRNREIRDLCDLLPYTLNVPYSGLDNSPAFSFGFSRDPLDILCKYVQLVNHVIDGLHKIRHLRVTQDSDTKDLLL